MKTALTLLVCLALPVISFSQNIVDASFGKGIRIQAADSSFALKLGLRFQSLYTGHLDLETKDWDENFLIRRARVKFDGFAYTPKLEYKIELAISNRDNGKIAPESNLAANIVLDAVLKYHFSKNWQVWFGQTKLPGNRERVISSQKLQFVDRSQLNSQFNIDRGMSIQLHHKHNAGQMIIKEKIAASFGEGRNRTAANVGGYEYTVRLELLPFGAFSGHGDYFSSDLAREKTPKLALGGTYDQNNNTTRERGFRGNFLSKPVDQKIIFLDGVFKYRGFSSMFEFAKKWTNPSPVVSDGIYYTGTGLNLYWHWAQSSGRLPL